MGNKEQETAMYDQPDNDELYCDECGRDTVNGLSLALYVILLRPLDLVLCGECYHEYYGEHPNPNDRIPIGDERWI